MPLHKSLSTFLLHILHQPAPSGNAATGCNFFSILIKHPYVSSTPPVSCSLLIRPEEHQGERHTSPVCVQLRRCVWDSGALVWDKVDVSQCFSVCSSVWVHVCCSVAQASLCRQNLCVSVTTVKTVVWRVCVLICMISMYVQILPTGCVTPQILKVLLFNTLSLMLLSWSFFQKL